MNAHSTVARLLAEILSADPSEMTSDFPLRRDRDVTPLDIAKLAIACEGAFGFALFDEKVAQWRTLGDVVRMVEELVEEGQTQPIERTDEERTAWYYE